MKEEATKRSALYNSIFKLKKRLPLSVYDGRKPLYQAVSTSLPTGIRGRTAYLHCIKDGKNIDPPYNTGSAFEHYDDNLEHSIWLRLMRARLEILRNLLSEDGTIWIQIDVRG